MSVKVLMPALSPTMEKGNLTRWLKAEGDAVKPGDVIAEIETDKATMEVEAVDEGMLGKILVPAGTNDVPVNERHRVDRGRGRRPEDTDGGYVLRQRRRRLQPQRSHPRPLPRHQPSRHRAMSSPFRPRRPTSPRAVSPRLWRGGLPARTSSILGLSPAAARMAASLPPM